MGHIEQPRTVEEGQRLRASVAKDPEEFFAIYRSSDALDPQFGTSLLLGAVSNKDIDARARIMNRLMDDGVDVAGDVRGARVLNTFMGYRIHDFEAEAPLVQRLLDEGADVNWGSRKSGTPLECLAAQFRYSESAIAPFVDVLLAHPGLDPLAAGMSGRPVLINIRKWRMKRSGLVARLEALLVERGVEVPADETD